MADFQTNVRYIKGIGEKKAQALNKLNISTLYDLVCYFPRKYEDRSTFKPIGLTLPNETVCISAMVADTPKLVRIRRGLDMVKFKIVDDSGSIDVTYFNQSYVKDQFCRGETYSFYGKVVINNSRRTMSNPVAEQEDKSIVTGKIVPIYKLTSGITQRNLMMAVRYGLDECGILFPEVLPEDVRKTYNLCQAPFAYENIHFPSNYESLELARKRLIFEELFLLACAMGSLKKKNEKYDGIKTSSNIDEFVSGLPFKPTNAQNRVINEAICDMHYGKAMNRLVQGDVGSGKTLVAAALIWHVWKNGYISAFMAPTEILAEQHLKTLQGFLSPYGIVVEKLIGSMSVKEKNAVKKRLKNGEIDVLVGTHALLSKDVEYPNLGLVITDEQHRFGVEQRSALVEKAEKPHVLVMSATPIPRTLALMIYGELDVSKIDELPPGRQKVDTFSVNSSYHKRIYKFIDNQVKEGRQAFVVCPMIEESDDSPDNLKSATEYTQELRKFLPNLRIECIHGKMKQKDKDIIMNKFVNGNIDVIVSTTVIEVGVDVPNASLMIIENAERFGLSQLHQLRGRVGRGQHKSYCILVSDAENDEAKQRLDTMVKTSDGYAIAERDLAIRGPGDFFGTNQHGLPNLHIADLCTDMSILEDAQKAAQEVLASDPDLSKAEHKNLSEKVIKLFSDTESTMN